MPRTFTIAVLAACAACGEGGEAPRRGESRLADEVQAPGHAPAGRADEPGASGGRGDRHARAAARRSPTVKRAEGTLARAGERSVAIRQAGAPELTLRVAPGTTITVNGRPARLATLREGIQVGVAYRTGSGGRPTAISIEARSAPDRGAAPEGTPGAPADGGG